MPAMNQASPYAARFSSAMCDVTDAWQHSQTTTHWSYTLEQLGPAPFFGSTRELWLGPMQIIHEKVSQSFTYRGNPWKGCRMFVLFLPDAGTPYYDGRPLASGLLETHRWDAVDRIVCGQGVECVLVAIDEKFLLAHAEQAVGSGLLSGLRHHAILSSDPAVTMGFRDGIFDLLGSVRQNPALIRAEYGRRMLQDRTLDMLVKVLEAADHSADGLPHSSTRAYVVDKAVELMEEELPDPIALADICSALRICSRTLRYSFEHVLGVSPARYLLARRLNGVRRDLIRGGREGTIEEVALRWGFWHMSRFAHFYREIFGERPSDTWRRVRIARVEVRAPRRMAGRVSSGIASDALASA